MTDFELQKIELWKQAALAYVSSSNSETAEGIKYWADSTVSYFE